MRKSRELIKKEKNTKRLSFSLSDIDIISKSLDRRLDPEMPLKINLVASGKDAKSSSHGANISKLIKFIRANDISTEEVKLAYKCLCDSDKMELMEAIFESDLDD